MYCIVLSTSARDQTYATTRDQCRRSSGRIIGSGAACLEPGSVDEVHVWICLGTSALRWLCAGLMWVGVARRSKAPVLGARNRSGESR